jgi:hypothetical protein
MPGAVAEGLSLVVVNMADHAAEGLSVVVAKVVLTRARLGDSGPILKAPEARKNPSPRRKPWG